MGPTLRSRFSRGSASLRMSHHSTWPSEDTVISSDPVLDCSQAMSYTGSLHATHRCQAGSGMVGSAASLICCAQGVSGQLPHLSWSCRTGLFGLSSHSSEDHWLLIIPGMAQWQLAASDGSTAGPHKILCMMVLRCAMNVTQQCVTLSPVAVLDGGCVHRRAALAHIKVGKLAVVLAHAQHVGVLQIVVDGGELALGLQLQLRLVGVADVPHIAVDGGACSTAALKGCSSRSD